MLFCTKSGIESFDSAGYSCSKSQEEFEHYYYKYIGRISDFINKKTIEAFLRNGKIFTP